MGKKRHIRSGVGDLVPLPGSLHKQMEGGRIVKTKQAGTTTGSKSDSDSDEGREFIDAGLSAKILEVARLQVESDEEEGFNDAPQEEEHSARRSAKGKKVRFTDGEDDGTTSHGPQREPMIPINTEGLSPEVVELYKEVGVMMSKYRSGKIPKAFKVIPSLANWEQMLELTGPENWTAAAMFQATRIFSSSMTPTMCQKFYNFILLPRIRDDIHEFKRLNPHLYESIFKAIFKPAAFFKGLLLPLCKSDDCTLREANIIGNVLKKMSMPALHSSAAMLRIAEMEFSPARSVFLRFLIGKNYTLPFRVIDSLVSHFLSMQGRREDSPLPVLWHRCLLAFVESYKSDMGSEQREALVDLVKCQNHPQITPEIRHHLQTAKSRGEENVDNIPERTSEVDMEF